MPKKEAVRPVAWLGDSKKQLKKMPEDVQKQMGGELYLAQAGMMPPHAKPLKEIGRGVFEIKDDYDTNTYRLVYAVRIGTRLYVLHAFQKKSNTGIATSKKDVEMIARRYKDACAMEKEHTS